MLELATLIARQARYRPEATAVVFEDQRLSYRQFWSRVARAGNMLRRLGLGPGDKIATCTADSMELLETSWAVPTIGAALAAVVLRPGADIGAEALREPYWAGRGRTI